MKETTSHSSRTPSAVEKRGAAKGHSQPQSLSSSSCLLLFDDSSTSAPVLFCDAGGFHYFPDPSLLSLFGVLFGCEFCGVDVLVFVLFSLSAVLCKSSLESPDLSKRRKEQSRSNSSLLGSSKDNGATEGRDLPSKHCFC